MTLNKYCQALAVLRSKPAHELKEVGDQWRTPDLLFWGINALFGPLVLDLFADGDNAKCPAWYTAEDNALTQDWSERLAADLAEQKQQLTNELAAAAPKVAFVDRYCTASGSMSFRQVAKLLKAKEPDLRLFLLENDIMYRLGGTMTPRHQHIDAGRFEVKTGTSVTSNHAFSQARFTAKGVRWIGGLWAEHIARGQVA